MKKTPLSKVLCILLCIALAAALTGCKSGAVKDTEKLIAAIGEVTVESKDAVEAAEAAYAALPDSDKSQVEGAETLTDARAALDTALRVKNVSDLIDAIGAEITLESREAVEAAEAALEKLPDGEKAMLANADALTAARAALDEARRQVVLGTWYSAVDGTDLIVGQIAEGLDIPEEETKEMIGEFLLPSVIDLREDGTYLISIDGERLKSGTMAMMEKLRPAFSDLFIRALGEGLKDMGLQGDLTTREGIEAALGKPLDEILKLSAGSTLDELLDMLMEQLDKELDLDTLAEKSQEGNYLLDLDESMLYFSQQLDEEPDTANGECFRLEDGKLVVFDHTGEGGFFEGFYPVTLTREP